MARRPKDSKFTQQELWAYQPCMTPNKIISTFATLGGVALAFGIGIYVSDNGLVEYSYDYTDCVSVDDNVTQCYKKLADPNVNTCQCILPIDDLPTSFNGKTVYIYYGLDNYYQNNRQYVKDLSLKQLYGDTLNGVPESGDCDVSPDAFPCGAIANSFFSDSLIIENIELQATNIAWDSDRFHKFGLPNDQENNKDPTESVCESAYGGVNITSPTNWTGGYKVCDMANANDGTILHPNSQGYVNEDLIVWYRTAATPYFRKLWRVKSSTTADLGTAPKITINYNYNVQSFEGRKKIIFSTIGWMGGKNSFLGVLYLVFGCLSLTFSGLFLVKQMIKPRIIGDPKLLKWSDM